MSPPDGGPTARVIAEAVQKVEDRVSLFGFCAVAGWSINIEIPIITHYPGLVEVVMDRAVGDFVDFPRWRSRSGHMHNTPSVEQVRLHQGIRWIDQGHIVGHE